jgi:uncharacterized membrane protein HdeD (DUF308 family)
MMNDMHSKIATDHWLKRYYAMRAVFSATWVALAFTVGKSSPQLAAVLLVIYPAWDALANYFDAKRNGGVRTNPTQSINMAVSAIVTLGIAVTVFSDMHSVVRIFGAWAIFSGILQLATAVRRWRTAGAQWPMILSGAQSGLAGTFFIKQAADATMSLGITTIAPYAALGALYFAISAAILLIAGMRRSQRGETLSHT